VTEREIPRRSRHTLTPAQAFDAAVTLHRQGRLGEAGQIYRAILKLDSNHFEALQYLGMICTSEGNPQEAERLIRQALTLKPDSADARANLGIALAALDRLDEALAEYEKAVVLDPQHVEARNNLGNTLHTLGRSGEAIPHFEHAIAARPQLAELHNNLANALAALNRPEEAIARYERAVTLRPDFSTAYNNLGVALAALKRHENAITAFSQAIALKPDYVEAHMNLGNVLVGQNRYEEAIANFERALVIKPNAAETHNELGNALALLDRHEEAIAHFERACALRAHFPEALNNLGNALVAAGHHSKAVPFLEKALAIRPDFAEARIALGSALAALPRTDEAIDCYQRVLAAAPDMAEAHSGLGTVLQTLGRLREARQAMEAAIRLAPEKAEYYRSLVGIRRTVMGDPYLEAMENLARDLARLPKKEQIALHFALGKAYDDLGKHQLAFDHLLAGNALKRKEIAYDEAAALTRFERIKAVFTPELMQQKRGLGHPSDVPVFIVGMPRSGTSLIEQMLASHPDVFGAGELRDIAAALAEFDRRDHGPAPFPEIASYMDEMQLRQFGARYVNTIRALAPTAARITDKMPSNFMFVGLIHLALPHARIIHTRRDPVDTCLSCFSHQFGHGLEWSCDLGELGRYYRQYQQLMAHWRRMLPSDAMLEVRYEDLVADFEPQARRLLAYCGLDWDERCLAFHKTQRPVRTASAGQVRQPIYRTSVGRWRPYQKMLQPLLEELRARDSDPEQV
jgi:tetratricopeptide (TPR) repeat protein